MNKTNRAINKYLAPITVTTDELAQMLSCGVAKAKRIGEESGAKVDSGDRCVLWCVEKVREYIYEIAC